MVELKIDVAEAIYSRLGFAAELNRIAQNYKSDVLIVIESENRVSGQVDLKSYLGVAAVMSNQSKNIYLKIIGEDEEFAATDLNYKINNLLIKFE